MIESTNLVAALRNYLSQSETAAGRLGRWFAAQCNGDWEHMNGVKIDTTDNPGWYVKIDLDGTTAQNLTGKGKRGELTWEVVDGVLQGYDEGTHALDELLTLMADLLESQNAESSDGDFYRGIEWLACWMLDHVEGETVTEELLRDWKAWREAKKRQNDELCGGGTKGGSNAD